MQGNKYVAFLAFLMIASALVLHVRLAAAFRPNTIRLRRCSASSIGRPLNHVSQNVRTALWTSTDESIIDANNLELLEEVFKKYADKDGLMSKAGALKIPTIADMVATGDLLLEELESIWENAPKSSGVKGKVDVDGFVEVYRTIDDLFEDDGDEVEVDLATSEATPGIEEDSELVEIFAMLAKDGQLTKEQLKKWDEVETLIADTMLGEDEFEQLWSESCESETMNEVAFLKFNQRLDSLFEFDDDDLDEIIQDASEDALVMVDGETTNPGDLFELLKTTDGYVGTPQIKRWGELQEMITDGDVLASEVDEIFERALAVSKAKGALDKKAFEAFYSGIDDLFEDEDEETDSNESSKPSSLKGDLLRALELMNSDEDRLPCGLESTESEANLIMDLVTEIEKEEINLVRSKQGNVEPSDLAGEWEMLYSSSSAMKFNKGLSGIGGSFPNGKFGGLRQVLKTTSVMMDVEYSEFINVNPSASSFNVRIDGNWFLRQSVSLFSGEPSIVLSVEPNRVSYGPTSTRADHWKSLGPMNMLDVTYLDDDLRIMRGNTAVDSVFVFKRL